MRKIEYPNAHIALTAFHLKYYNTLSGVNISAINHELKKAPKFKGKILTFKKLVTFNFEELYELSNLLQPFISSFNTPTTVPISGGKTKTIIINSFNNLFNYKENQPLIASFFMQDGLDHRSCYYCGIEYVNSFKDIGDYKNYEDFLNRASKEELKYINGIGEARAISIITYRKRKKIVHPEDITSSAKIIKQLKDFNFRNSHNHFTLDHVLPQSNFPYLSLCLYNLVPSCYSCNSKFKGKKEFLYNKEILRVSPSSDTYSLNSDFNFRIFYANKLQDINSVNDFTLYKKIVRNRSQIENYSSIFKIDGRYTFHKSELLDLIKKKSEYSKSKIKKMALEMGKSQEEIKVLIFGKDIFNPDTNKPFQKLKEDIARNIKII